VARWWFYLTKKDEDNQEDKGFQKSKGTVTVIFTEVLGSGASIKTN
jgi:hypothetical protein